MSKKILIGGGVALVALVVAVASMLLFAKVQPTEAEVRAAVELALPDGAVVDQMTFAVFSDDRSKGRVSVKGTYSFSQDIYSLPTPPAELMRSLASAQIFDTDVARWWSENSSFYPQFKGKLGEFRKIYTSGESLEFAGELPYLAVVDGTKVDSTSLDYTKRDGTLEPEFGYAVDAEQISELSATIIEWRDRRRDEAAAAAAARAAEAEAAALAEAKAAEAEAAAWARAAEVEAEAAIKAAAAEAAAQAAAELAAKKANARTEAVDVRSDCRGIYAKVTNCRNVAFGVNEIYYTEVAPTIDPITGQEQLWCTFADPVDAGTWEHLGGRQFAFIPNQDNGPRVTFFEVKQGEKTPTGVLCQ